MHRVIARLNVGGPAIHVVELTARLARRGLPSTLWIGELGAGEADMSYLADARGVRPRRVPGLGPRPHPVRDLRALLALVRVFRKERPDIVHTHTAKAGALGRVAAALAGVPIRIHTYHGHVLGGAYFSGPVTAAYRAIERALARTSDRLLVLTPSQAAELGSRLGLEQERFAVVPLGLDLAPFLSLDDSDRVAARARLGLRPGDRAVAVVGRIAPVKNHDLLLRAFAALRGEGPAPRLWIVGGGEPALERRLRERASALGIAERVEWHGWTRDTRSVYAAMDAIVLTSHDEGTPVALIEALASGCPVVARAVGGVPEVLGDLGAARLVDDASPEVFAESLGRLLDDPPAPDQMAEARAQMERRFGIERLVGDLEVLYRAIARGESPPSYHASHRRGGHAPESESSGT